MSFTKVSIGIYIRLDPRSSINYYNHAHAQITFRLMGSQTDTAGCQVTLCSCRKPVINNVSFVMFSKSVAFQC